jgi:mRNA interferase MazF
MPTSERKFKRGDVVVVPFPYSDQLAEKRRPALVVSGSKFNSRTGYLWVVMITSKTHQALADDVALEHIKAGLSKASVIRVAKIATIEAGRVIHVAGRADAKAMGAVDKKLGEILA